MFLQVTKPLVWQGIDVSIVALKTRLRDSARAFRGVRSGVRGARRGRYASPFSRSLWETSLRCIPDVDGEIYAGDVAEVNCRPGTPNRGVVVDISRNALSSANCSVSPKRARNVTVECDRIDRRLASGRQNKREFDAHEGAVVDSCCAGALSDAGLIQLIARRKLRQAVLHFQRIGPGDTFRNAVQGD